MKQAVIFDVDGVIVFSEQAYQKRRERFFGQYGIKLDKKTHDLFVGSNLNDIFKYLIPDDVEKRNHLLKEYKKFQEKDTSVNYSKLLNPDIPKTLEILAKNNVRLAIASSGPLINIEKILQANQINCYFEQIVSGEMLNYNKPHPAIYNYSVNNLKLETKNCLVIEDSEIGIESAVRANLDVAALRNKHIEINQSKATYQIDSIKEVIELVL